ncbi:MAG: DUF1572 domain-containing protein [Chitinophagaceae bacterium]|jgi:hypothetical protein|nr:DUF1572 domain-containing protein [Chitinophagaceae bacterium]
MEFGDDFLKDVIKRFKNYKDLGDKTLAQLSEADLFYQTDPDNNSIAIIIQHMHGNMMSRWTNFLTEDGEKEWRSRDAEFEATQSSKEDILQLWEAGWSCLFNALASLKSEDLSANVTIRTEPIKVYDAILRQLTHYPYHVGQIVFIGRMLRKNQWQSLSIAKGDSHAYLNAVKAGTQKQP